MSRWENFYVIVGSSGGALIGLQFVVMTLIAERNLAQLGALDAFGTPTVVHLAAALIVSAIMNVPWSTGPASVAVLLCGLAGVGYTVVTLLRARRQKDYKPVFEDWVWYFAVPLAGYIALAIGGARLRADAGPFLVAFAALGLLLIGIRNAWDSVTHIVTTRPKTKE